VKRMGSGSNTWDTTWDLTVPAHRMVKKSRLTFRVRPWRPWLLAVVSLTVLAAVAAGMSALSGRPARAPVALFVFGGLALVLLLPIGLAVWVSRWHVDSMGIGGRNNYLAYHYLEWDEMDSVEQWLIPGYRYLQINGGGMRWAFWLPLFFTDMPGFRSAVIRYAPPANPLRRFLEKHPA
jgi:hypothetical protein